MLNNPLYRNISEDQNPQPCRCSNAKAAVNLKKCVPWICLIYKHLGHYLLYTHIVVRARFVVLPVVTVMTPQDSCLLYAFSSDQSTRPP